MKYNRHAELLDVFCWGVATVGRPLLTALLQGYAEEDHRCASVRLVQQLRQQKLIAARGRGARAEFSLTAQGRQRVRREDPEPHWQQAWDGAWRVVTFDLPETRRLDRKRLWQALRAHRFGFLQRSVWVWPHDVTRMLREIIKVEGVPECFCGFKATQLFLCTDAEIVSSAWEWTAIGLRQQQYLRQLPGLETGCRAARDPARLGTLARTEQQAYEQATVWDPLLPQALWPTGYQGRLLHQRHLHWRTLLCGRLSQMTGS